MADNTDKVAISQRWERRFLETTKLTAGKYGTSMTQLTTEALKLYLVMAENEKFVNMDPDSRLSEVIKSVRKHFEQIPDDTEKENIDLAEIKSIGFIRDQVEELLKMQPDRKFTTIEISEILGIPQSTARAYVRDVAEQDNFILIEGRPNRIYFNHTLSTQ